MHKSSDGPLPMFAAILGVFLTLLCGAATVSELVRVVPPLLVYGVLTVLGGSMLYWGARNVVS